MTKKSKLIILDVFILGIIVFGGYLIKNNYINYALIVFAIAVSFIIQELMYRFTGDTKEEKYETKLKKILKTYDSVLVETRKVPVIDSEKIILVNSLDDLIDAQLELRKMIYYFKQSDNCSFVLFDQNQANIFILKSNEEVISPLEIEINNNKIKNKNKNDIDEETLNEIDKTTIIKLPNDKAYKISPVRKQKKSNLKKDKFLFEE
mgnify:FL=1